MVWPLLEVKNILEVIKSNFNHELLDFSEYFHYLLEINAHPNEKVYTTWNYENWGYEKIDKPEIIVSLFPNLNTWNLSEPPINFLNTLKDRIVKKNIKVKRNHSWVVQSSIGITFCFKFKNEDIFIKRCSKERIS